MKKSVLAVVAIAILLSACDRKAFVKKLVGTWKISSYLFAGIDKTTYFDTTFREWKMVLNDDQVYTKTWNEYFLTRDSLVRIDTLGYDTLNSVFITQIDTLRFVDTTITPFFQVGKWELINSEEDLQLRNDSDNSVEIYRILDLTKNNLNLKKGNDEYHLGK